MSTQVIENGVKQNLEVTCDYCDEIFAITVNVEDLEKWANGILVQDAFSYLTLDEMELMISSTCGTCFDKMFVNFD